MSYWFSSWLPGLPSMDFALPSSIQGRFISFALKRSLGHLLKPGQLDINQIDSQIGSGYVQIRDLELDNEAINAAVAGLPVQLQDGRISSVTARIPWPNPLTSTVRLSLQSLHLTFCLNPPISSHSPSHSVNLAESVVTVAESFIHDELTPREEATLRESFHPDITTRSPQHDVLSVPGSMDPFLSDPESEEYCSDADPDGISIFASLIEKLLARFEFNAVDTKITFVHMGHTSFTFSIADINYRTEGKDSSTAPDVQASSKPATHLQVQPGQTRTVEISGVRVSARNMRSTAVSPSTFSPVIPNSPSRIHSERQSPICPRPASPTSSSSSLDEDTQFLMSQSIVSLPPRASSPANSTESSMYESAMGGSMYDSTVRHDGASPDHSHDRTSNEGSPGASRTPSPGPGCRADPSPSESCTELSSASRVKSDVANNPAEENDVILSFGAEAIVIQLTTPSPTPLSSPSSGNFSPTASSTSGPPHHTGHEVSMSKDRDKLQLSVTIGIIACSLRAWHIRSLLDALRVLAPQTSPPSPPLPSIPRADTSPKFNFELEASAKIRGIVIISLASSSRIGHQSSDADAMASYFSHPLLPPRLAQGYVRLFLDSLVARLSVDTVTPLPGSKMHTHKSSPTAGPKATTTFSLSLSDVSAFAFLPSGLDQRDTGLSASPILITDQHLTFQYPRHGVHLATAAPGSSGLPTFDVTDWTDGVHRTNSPKISLWRTKTKPKQPSADLVPAISAYVTRRVPEREHGDKSRVVNNVEVNLVPLHVFVDLGLALGDGCTMLEYLVEILGPGHESWEGAEHEVRCNESESEVNNDVGDDESHETPPATPRLKSALSRGKQERDRLEKLVMTDLDLDLNYLGNETSKTSKLHGKLPVLGAQTQQKRQRTEEEEQTSFGLNLSMIRIQIRCPPPSHRSPRSGALVFDLHDIRLFKDPATSSGPHARIATDDLSAKAVTSRPALISAQCKRIVVSCSLVTETKAKAVLSLGSLTLGEESSRFGTGANIKFPDSTVPEQPLCPRLTINQSELPPLASSLALNIDLPSVCVDVSKPTIDAIQYWIDDVGQLIEQTASKDTDTEPGDSEDASLIGSRFFSKSLRSKSSGSGSGFKAGPHVPAGSEFVVKVLISEASVRLLVPRTSADSSVPRPFDLLASDIDILLDFKPNGKDETALALSVMDLNLTDTFDNSTISLLSLTTSRPLLSSPKPLLKLRFISLTVPETTAKESRVKLTLWGFTYNAIPNFSWIHDLGAFVKAPPGAFESVIPSERTRVSLKIMDGSIRCLAPSHPGALVLHVGDLDFSTDLIGDSLETSFRITVPALSLLFLDDITGSDREGEQPQSWSAAGGILPWKGLGYALLSEITYLDISFKNSNTKTPDTQVIVDHITLRLHFCADTIGAVSTFVGDLSSAFKPPVTEQPMKPRRGPMTISSQAPSRRGLMSSVDEHAFQRVPEVGPPPDLISDDLPTNLDYLDASFGTAAGLRELRDEDLDEFDLDDTADINRVSYSLRGPQTGIVSSVGGETIKILRPEGIRIVENYFDHLLPDTASGTGASHGSTTLRVRVHNCDATMYIYDGYDWAKTRKTIEEEVKEMRRRLAKIRQLVASGQAQDPSVEETSALLFNSVYIGLEQDVDELEPTALIAAIDRELNDDLDTISQSSWQSLRPSSAGRVRPRSARAHGKRLTRSREPSIEFKLLNVDAEVDHYRPDEPFMSRTFVTVKDLEILDHIKTSTWKKFLTELRTDSRGNIRETDSNMVRVELRSVRPVPGHPSEEARLRAKILPLRLYVDQDALDFMKRFFSFKDPQTDPPTSNSSNDDIFFQSAEIFPVDIKLDYKPRRVDYRALREGRTIELMNFFHFDGAEMTLRHITLHGITGWPRLFDMLNDLWTPDVKATQLADVISGVSPIRSVVNVGSGVADLVLLPIAQYKKDGRIVRGMQKGTTAFVKSTAIEAVKLGARLATGTQVILEQAESVLGGQFSQPMTTETVQSSPLGGDFVTSGLQTSDDEQEGTDLISKYAEQPVDIKEGVQTAYKSLQRNFHSAAQTILAVPMEVYERSGNEGPVRSVIRAVPIAVLKPMIGASEAVSKTLLGLHNTLDPNIRFENEAKYKQR